MYIIKRLAASTWCDHLDKWSSWLWQTSDTQDGFMMHYINTAFPVEEEVSIALGRIYERCNVMLDNRDVLSITVYRGTGWNMDMVTQLVNDDSVYQNIEMIAYLQFDDETLGVQFKLAHL